MENMQQQSGRICECQHASCYHQFGAISKMFAKGKICMIQNCYCLRFTPAYHYGDGQAMPGFRG